METPARARPSRFRPAGPASGQIALYAALALLTAAAWFVTIRQLQTMLPMAASAPTAPTRGMTGSPAVSGAPAASDAPVWPAAIAAGAFVAAWSVMMAAMMLPAAAPMIALHHRIASRPSGARPATTAIFALSYLLVWAAVGLPVWALTQIVAPRLSADWARWSPLALGATLVVAGAYQFSPWKRACLRHCQSPFGFLMTHWRDGYGGAARMGLAHAGYCLGCCWALFALLVAAGTMSLPWMLLLTLLIVAEKALPGGERTAAASGAALIVLGLLVGTGVMPMPWRM